MGSLVSLGDGVEKWRELLFPVLGELAVPGKVLVFPPLRKELLSQVLVAVAVLWKGLVFVAVRKELVSLVLEKEWELGTVLVSLVFGEEGALL